VFEHFVNLPAFEESPSMAGKACDPCPVKSGSGLEDSAVASEKFQVRRYVLLV